MMTVEAAENPVECVLSADDQNVLVKLSKKPSSLRKQGERRLSTRRNYTVKQQYHRWVGNDDVMGFNCSDIDLSERKSVSFNEDVRVKITPRYQREDIPSLFYSCSDIKQFRISAYLCAGSPLEDEDDSSVHPMISEGNGLGGTWCINFCLPSTTSFWQISAAGQ